MRAYLLGFSMVALLSTPVLADVKMRCEGTVTANQRAMAGEVHLEASPADGRVKLPNALLPPVRNGDVANGWRPLQAVQLADADLSARIGLSVLDQPQLRLDRQTGQIELTGFGGSAFSGRCADHG